MPTDAVKPYRELRRYIVLILCVAAAVPLALIGGGIYYEYSKSLSEKVKENFTGIVVQHKQSIEKFLSETTSAMKLIANLEPLERISQKEYLTNIFMSLQKEYDHAFEDLGVIDSRGDHIAYVGPYDLRDKNYASSPWFRETLDRGLFISDVFLGFRKFPHFIIACRQGEGEGAWILRATVNAAKFADLVENVRLGRTGGAFIINREGFYQSRSWTGGNVMEKADADFVNIATFGGVRFSEGDRRGRQVIRVKTWLKDNNWLLVVQQDVDDAFSELYTTRNRAIVVFILGAILISAVSFFTTKLLVRKIENADRGKKLLDEQLIQSQKLASIGELSAGVAHEINNPLAVIGEEAGWLQDLLRRDSLKDNPELAEFHDSLREIRVQTGRCKEITHKLLSFARKMESVLKDVDLNKLIEEVISMREREASFLNIVFVKKFQGNLSVIYSDPSLIRQVLLNFINNAMDAMPKGGEITIETFDNKSIDNFGNVPVPHSAEGVVVINIRDTGHGIPKENMSKLFDPFFTTKDPGKGTGLGLSICHGIIEKLGGTISVVSHVGEGTTFTIQIPIEHNKGALQQC